MIGSFEPESIESETSTAHRSLLKLEKSFHVPLVRKLVDVVKSAIEEFKEHMPIVMTLGNPGMKQRHWNQVSEIVGFPIKVDTSMTLSKVFFQCFLFFYPRLNFF